MMPNTVVTSTRTRGYMHCPSRIGHNKIKKSLEPKRRHSVSRFCFFPKIQRENQLTNVGFHAAKSRRTWKKEMWNTRIALIRECYLWRQILVESLRNPKIDPNPKMSAVAQKDNPTAPQKKTFKEGRHSKRGKGRG